MPPATKPTVAAKLNALADEVERTGFANTTRLTVVKKWLNEPARLRATAVFVAKSTLGKRVASGNEEERELWDRSAELFANAEPLAENFHTGKVSALHMQLIKFQNVYRHDQWGAIRIIESLELLIIERAIGIMLDPERPDLGYKLVADHLASYHPSHGPGLYPVCLEDLHSLAHFVEDIEGR